MTFKIKKLLFAATFNLSLFALLFIGIQNSSNKNKVNLLIDKSVELPIGFIVGTSFIGGSIFGGILSMFSKVSDKKE